MYHILLRQRLSSLNTRLYCSVNYSITSDAEGEQESYHRTNHSQGRKRGDPDISERRERSEGGNSEHSARGIRVRRERVTTREQFTSEEEVDTQSNKAAQAKNENVTKILLKTETLKEFQTLQTHFHFFSHTLKRN